MSLKDWPVRKIETEKRRAAILQHLDDTPGYQLNATILKMGADAQGIPSTDDQMVAALDWLEEMELVVLERLPSILVATLTKSGQEVARGKRIVTGITRPGPEF